MRRPGRKPVVPGGGELVVPGGGELVVPGGGELVVPGGGEPVVSGRCGRRAALRAGALALAAAALRPAPARGASDEGGLLLGLWRREMGAALAYRTVLHVDPLLALLRSHEADHAAAIATELAAVGLGTPPAPHEPADLDIGAERLAGAGSDRAAALAAAVALEEDLVAVYRSALPALPDAKIAMTAATILASHAQHLLILRRAAGVT